MSERRGTKALETWCRRLTEGYPGVKVENMTTSWRDGLAFCAIIHHFRPDLIDFASLSPSNIYYNNSLAFSVAERQLGIPALLDAEDMVMYSVPDRLSILTYLSQFYQVFGNQNVTSAGGKQGSSQRIIPKRSALSTERTMIPSASSSPPSKMASRSSIGSTTGGIARREPCAKCGYPVFLAERLNVGTKLYHRTCFRCARCNNQLSLANCYETETEEYCCETCPDEEEPNLKIAKFDSLDNVGDLNEPGKTVEAFDSPDTDSKKLNPNVNTTKFDSLDNDLNEPVKTIDSPATDSKKLNLNVKISKFDGLDNDPVKSVETFDSQDTDSKKLNPNVNTTNFDSLDNESDLNRPGKTVETFDSPDTDSKKLNSNVKISTLDNDLNEPVKTVQTFDSQDTDRKKLNSNVDTTNFDSLDNESDLNRPGKTVETFASQDTDRKKLISNAKITKFDSLDNDLNEPVKTIDSLATDSKKLNRLEEVRNRSLSDEEKSKGLQNFDDDDDDEYSADFEQAVEKSNSLSKARNNFLSSHLLTEDIPPPLPKSKPPDISSPSGTGLTTEENQQFVSESTHVNTLNLVLKESEVVHTTNIDNNQQTTASEQTTNLQETNITKDINRPSLVKSRMLLFETNIVSKKDDSVVPSKKSTAEESLEEKAIEPSEELLNKTVESEADNSDSIGLISSIATENSPPIDVKPSALSQSVIANLSVDQSAVSLTPSILEETYPDDLNPFGDEDEAESNIKQVIKPSMEDLTVLTPPREEREEKEEKRKSTNPFGSSDEEEEIVRQKPPRPPLPTVRREGKKVLDAPKINLNPFWSDGEEPSDEEINVKPVPMPRTKHISTPEPKPRHSGLSNNASYYDSNSSLSSLNSSIGHTPGRKKKPAPPPPMGISLSPEGSKQSSPSTSTHPSPKLTPRVRKNRKAPLPPSSTPFVSDHSIADNINVSSISKPDQEESSVISPTGSDIEKEKISKDEKNRNRQSQTISSPALSDSESLSLSQQGSSPTDKSTHGKWKRKKGPAPARPVPQRRQIRPLPLAELRRELDIIEMQQQGLEKQGVKLEQLIREKCETPETTDDTALSPEVEDLVLELFELVNEKNELFRRQAELMYLRRQQRLEEEHADLEYQIRCLMERPERNKTDSDKAREEELINRLLEVVERRNEIVECLEMDRVREAEEDQSINFHLSQLASKKEEDQLESPIKLSKKEKKKMKKEKKLKEKGKGLDADKDIDETETSSMTLAKDKKKKKWF